MCDDGSQTVMRCNEASVYVLCASIHALKWMVAREMSRCGFNNSYSYFLSPHPMEGVVAILK